MAGESHEVKTTLYIHKYLTTTYESTFQPALSLDGYLMAPIAKILSGPKCSGRSITLIYSTSSQAPLRGSMRTQKNDQETALAW